MQLNRALVLFSILPSSFRSQDIMIKSAIGIVFIMLAWTIVTYVASSLGYTKI